MYWKYLLSYSLFGVDKVKLRFNGVEKGAKTILVVAVAGPLDPDDADDVFAFVVSQIPQTLPSTTTTQPPSGTST